jgi:hypothetical protein
MFGSSPQKMAGLCYVTPVTGHKAYIGKEEEEEENSLGVRFARGLWASVRGFQSSLVLFVSSSLSP